MTKDTDFLLKVIEIVSCDEFVHQTGIDEFRDYHFDLCDKCYPDSNEIDYQVLLKHWEPDMLTNAISVYEDFVE